MELLYNGRSNCKQAPYASVSYHTEPGTCAALDAGASCIHVGVNTDNYHIEVEDNGVGILVEDLEQLAKSSCMLKLQTNLIPLN